MKFIVSIFLTALLGFITGLYMPWWGIAIAALIVSMLLHQSHGKAFLAGFLGIFLLWGILAWAIDVRNSSILSKKIAQLLPLGGSVFLLIIVTALTGALVAGFGALTGSYLRKTSDG